MIKRFFSALVVSVALVAFAAGSVSAMELWDPHLRGVNEGLAAGALPPAGVYFINNAYFAAYKIYDNNGNRVNSTKLNAYVDVPLLLWSTGLNVLGAKYGVAIAEPFDFTELRVGTPGKQAPTWDNWGVYNTVIVPAILSWSLPMDFKVAAKLSVYMPSASSTWAPNSGNIPAGGNVIELGSGNGNWTFEPGLGLSWLHAGFNISADLKYDFCAENGNTHYKSGQEFAADYTAAYSLGKWTFGLGAYQENQVTKDIQFNQRLNHSQVTNFGMGPLLGYNFGPCSLMFSYNWGLETKNDVGGNWCNLRLVVPLKFGN